MELLPIGSIVTLKGADKKVMICGRIQTNIATDETFDYSACMYPEGIIDSKEMLVFNHESIEEVYFTGFQDEEELSFKEMLKNTIN